MAKFSLDPIYKGGTSPGALRALRTFIAEHGPFITYVVPNAGAFGVPETLICGDVPASKVVTCGTTLYTSTLGYLLDPEKSLLDLKFEITNAKLLSLCSQGPTEKPENGHDLDIAMAARMVYSLKWCQLQRASLRCAANADYKKWRRLEIEEQVVPILNRYAETLATLRTRAGGLRYEIMDPHSMAATFADDPSAFIWYSAPGAAGGRESPVKPEDDFAWADPGVKPPKRDDVLPFVESELAGANACAAAYLSEKTHPYAGPWEPIYIQQEGQHLERTYVFANRHSKSASLKVDKRRSIPENPPSIYDDHEITADTKISFVHSDMDTSLYFYDLFVKDLAITRTQIYYLFCIDGQVAGALGLDVQHHCSRNDPVFYITFGLTMTSPRYARIGRLFMASAVTRQFTDQIERECFKKDLLLPQVEDVQTTCLSKFPEVKKNRSILKMVQRTRLPNGRFHLVYRTKIHEKTFGDVLAAWLAKHAKFGRTPAEAPK